MILEHKHKIFKDEYKIKERVNMSILVALILHYFQELLNWWHSPFKLAWIDNPLPNKYSKFGFLTLVLVVFFALFCLPPSIG
jgi:hypothetical protein